MKKQKFYWKLVRGAGDDSSFCSSNGSLPIALIHRYRFDKYTKVKPTLMRLGYGLCVFRTRKQAREFRKRDYSLVNGRYGRHLLKCEARGVRVPTTRRAVDKLHILADGVKPYCEGYFWPEGTMHADSVKLVK